MRHILLRLVTFNVSFCYVKTAKRKDAKKLMEVFSLYEEERVRPRPRTLRYVAKVLESQGQPAPFEVPSAEQVSLLSHNSLLVGHLFLFDIFYVDF